MEEIPGFAARRPLTGEDSLSETRNYLESLTTRDLIKLADNCGIDIPPGLDRIFIIEELLDIASRDEPEADTPDVFAVEPLLVPRDGAADSGLEPVPLPRYYNITFIEVMIRDPLWAFVFWEVKASEKEQFEKSTDFDGYYLKVSPLGVRGNAARPGTEADDVFTVPVRPEDSAWYLGLSPAAPDENPSGGEARALSSAQPSGNAEGTVEKTRYKVELCAGMKGGETILAVSNPFNLPFFHEPPARKGSRESSGMTENPLVRLSGYGDFHVLHRNERLLRVKGSAADSYE